MECYKPERKQTDLIYNPKYSDKSKHDLYDIFSTRRHLILSNNVWHGNKNISILDRLLT